MSLWLNSIFKFLVLLILMEEEWLYCSMIESYRLVKLRNKASLTTLQNKRKRKVKNPPKALHLQALSATIMVTPPSIPFSLNNTKKATDWYQSVWYTWDPFFSVFTSIDGEKNQKLLRIVNGIAIVNGRLRFLIYIQIFHAISLSFYLLQVMLSCPLVPWSTPNFSIFLLRWSASISRTQKGKRGKTMIQSSLGLPDFLGLALSASLLLL